MRAGILPDLAAKDWDFAKIVPGEHSTYNYPNEEGYPPVPRVPQYSRVPVSTPEYRSPRGCGWVPMIALSALSPNDGQVLGGLRAQLLRDHAQEGARSMRSHGMARACACARACCVSVRVCVRACVRACVPTAWRACARACVPAV